jgi:hypothetical protein
MENIAKITNEQIEAMQDYLSGFAFANKKKREDLKLFYSALTPNDIYVKYTSYGLLPDNGIESIYKILCIKPNGEKKDCLEQFENINQRLEFESNLIEIDLDANGNLVIV